MKIKSRMIILFIPMLILSIACSTGKAQTKDGRIYGNNEKIDEIGFEDDSRVQSNSGDRYSRDERSNRYDKNDKYSRNDRYDRNEKYNRRDDDRIKSARKSVKYENRGSRDKYGDSAYRRERYFQTGKASWYGREFQGKTTASGERFDMYDMTAAHKTLPFGTIVEIKNFNNKRVVRVKINDRGPYRGKRIIDLSYNAAKKLDMVQSGTAMVGVRIVRKGYDRNDGRYSRDTGDNGIEAVVNSDRDNHVEERNNIYNRDSGRFSIQTGAFYSKNNADKFKRRVEDITRKPVVVIQDGDMYKVRVEGLRSSAEVRRCKRLLGDDNIQSFVVE